MNHSVYLILWGLLTFLVQDFNFTITHARNISLSLPRPNRVEAFYKMNESNWSASNAVRDTSIGGTMHGTSTPFGVPITDSERGRVGSFNGNSFVTIPSMLDTRNSYTVSVWVKLTQNQIWKTMMSQNGNNASSFFLMILGNGKFAMRLPYTDSTNLSFAIAESLSAPEVGKWYYVTGVRNASTNTVSLYVDGNHQQSFTHSPINWNVSGNFILGAAKWGPDVVDHFIGSLDNAIVYDVALNADEIRWLYTSNSPISPPTSPPTPDTEAPSIPQGLAGSNITYNSVELSWTPSTDNVGVSFYRVFRNGVNIAQPTSPGFRDSTLNPSTEYTYRVAAVDTSDNSSLASAPFVITTPQQGNPVSLYPFDGQIPGSMTMRTSIEQYGIRWTFDKPYPTGNFANSDPWVAPNAGDVGVRIIAIDPPLTDNGTELRNGWMVNPSGQSQAYDNRGGSAFTRSALPVPANPSSGNPYIAAPNSSIIKSASLDNPTTHAALRTAAILTVLPTVPDRGGVNLFRPPYYGSNKPLRSLTEIDVGWLPRLQPVVNTPDISQLADRIQRVELNHTSGWESRKIHAIENGPDYWSDVDSLGIEVVLRTYLNDPIDPSTTSTGMSRLLVNVIQRAIDQKALMGLIDVQYYPNEVISALAAGLLHDDAMSSNVRVWHGEVQHIYYSPAAGMVLFGAPDQFNHYWSALISGNGGRNVRDPVGLIDGGEVPNGYQSCCYALALVARAVVFRLSSLVVASFINPHHVISYAQRYHDVGVHTQPDYCAPAVGTCAVTGLRCTTAMGAQPSFGCAVLNNAQGVPDPWLNRCALNASLLGVEYGPVPGNPNDCIRDTDLSDGIGRFVALHGVSANSGNHGQSPFAQALWNAYW